MNIVDFARELSHKLHANQKRNDGKPYTTHTDYVGDNAFKFLPKNATLRDIALTTAIGYLHDAIEDQVSETELSELGKHYGEDWEFVVISVVILSRSDKSTSVIEYLKYIKQGGWTTAVKLADLEHNLSDLGPGNLRDKYHLCQEYLKNGN
jgi:(p)ppGpp synthase/HD superfamily hydrolase